MVKKTSHPSVKAGLLLIFFILPLTATAQRYASADLSPLSVKSGLTPPPSPAQTYVGGNQPSPDITGLTPQPHISYRRPDAYESSELRSSASISELHSLHTQFINAGGIPMPSDGISLNQKSTYQRGITTADFYYVPPQNGESEDGTLLNAIREKPGWAMLSSAVVPGSGQLVNNKYLRGALYLAVEATALAIHFNQQAQALEQKDRYHRFANENWSVVNYARWLINYHDANGLTRASQAVDQLRVQISDVPSDNIPYGRNAWDEVDLSTLRKVERHTPYVYTDGRVGNIFSHTLPDYGSQQYYELISKYFQFGPGWDDYGQTRGGGHLQSLYQLSWNRSDMPPHWHRGAVLADRFNESFRLAGNMLKLLLVNHVISAFDAFFTVKIKQHKLEANATLIKGGGSLMTLNYQF